MLKRLEKPTTPDTFYFVTVNFTDLGFGSGGDVTPCFDDAVDQYVDAYGPARVFRVDMDAENNPARVADVTADADEVVAHRMGGAA